MDHEPSAELIPMSDPGPEPDPPEFDIVLRGYDRRQVDDYLDRVESELAAAQSDRDAAATQVGSLDQQLRKLHRETADLRKLAEEIERPSYAGLGARVQELLHLAEQEAAELRAHAENDAAQLRQSAAKVAEEASSRSEQARRDFEESLAARRVEAEAEDAERRAQAEREVAELRSSGDQMLAEAHAEAQRIQAEAEAAAAQVLAETRAAAEQLRNDAEEHAGILVESARNDAQQILERADREATERRSVVNAEIEELTQRRDTIHAQLAQLREVLGSVPLGGAAVPTVTEVVDAAPDEQGAPAPGENTAAGDRRAEAGEGGGTEDARTEQPEPAVPAEDPERTQALDLRSLRHGVH